MAVPVIDGTVSSGTFSSGSGNFNTAHTVAAGLTNSILVVLTANAQGVVSSAAGWDTDLMTRLPWTTNNFFGAAYYLKSPKDGTFNVGVTWPVLSRAGVVVVATFTGAKLVTSGSSNTASGSDSAPTVTFPSSYSTGVALDLCASFTATHTQGGGQTEIKNVTVTNGQGSTFRYSASTKDSVDVGNDNTMSVALGSALAWQIFGLQVESYPDFTDVVGSPMVL